MYYYPYMKYQRVWGYKMCTAIMYSTFGTFSMGEKVEVEYFGLMSGHRMYLVYKLDNPMISDVVFECFLRVIK